MGALHLLALKRFVLFAAAAAAIVFTLTIGSAHAAPAICGSDTGCFDAPAAADAPRYHARTRHVEREGVRIIGGVPHGCPRRLFCGCGLAKYWGIWRPSLNLVANWVREFPRASGPAIGVAAVRHDRHHIRGIIGGHPGAWRVVDFNLGRHLSREYTVASFPGYFFIAVR